MSKRVEVWGASGLIKEGYDDFFLSPAEGLRAPQGMMDRLGVPHLYSK